MLCRSIEAISRHSAEFRAFSVRYYSVPFRNNIKWINGKSIIQKINKLILKHIDVDAVEYSGISHHDLWPSRPNIHDWLTLWVFNSKLSFGYWFRLLNFFLSALVLFQWSLVFCWRSVVVIRFQLIKQQNW